MPDEMPATVARIVCYLAKGKVRHGEAGHEGGCAELGLDHDQAVEFVLELVDREHDAGR